MESPASTDSKRRFGADVIFKHWRLKSIGTMAFIVVFLAAYIYLLKHPAFPVMQMPVTWVDHWIGFQPWTLPAYVSLWVYVSLPPTLLTSRRTLFGYGWGIAAVCLVGLLVFFMWPTAVPPADIDWDQYPGMSVLKGVDAAGNACPSLHVATAVFSAIWLQRLLFRLGAAKSVLVLNWIWCGAILFSTIATRQHVLVDLIGGLVLGLVGAELAWWMPHFQSLRSADSSIKPSSDRRR